MFTSEAETRFRPDSCERGLVELGKALKRHGYQFITTTPATHARVVGRNSRRGCPLRALFGWSEQVALSELPPEWLALMRQARVSCEVRDKVASTVRFSSIGDLLFAHSAFPTNGMDSAFFGPDTYRFARLVRQTAAAFRPHRIFDIGCGSGAGGIVALRALGRPFNRRLVMSDINEKALGYAAINAEINDIACASTVLSDGLENVSGSADLIISNPPYMIDRAMRSYRNGGGRLGCELSLRIALEAVDRLAPGGRLVLYTGSAIVDGRDTFLCALKSALANRRRSFAYEEIDPDVFGEELDTLPYSSVERIAAVVCTIGADEA